MEYDFHAGLAAVRHHLAEQLQSQQSFTEHQLIQGLQQQGLVAGDALRDSLTLFRCHFIVMHCLYSLRQQWRAEQRQDLTIGALHIQVVPLDGHYQADNPGDALQTNDPLATYYLDLTQLSTDRIAVEELLRSFWQRLDASEHQQRDLEALELTANANGSQVRQQYKRLAMRYHPDRGGDQEQFRRISQAYERLKTQFN
jgi:hypothetical protein